MERKVDTHEERPCLVMMVVVSQQAYDIFLLVYIYFKSDPFLVAQLELATRTQYA